MVNKEEIKHIADLRMLNLSEDEIQKFTAHMQDIVEFANKVNSLETEGVTESAFALDTFNVFRKDEVRDSFDREELLQNAPSSNGEAYSLPSMMN